MSNSSVANLTHESPANEAGVSLIELLIVLSIITILGAISVSFISRHTRTYKTEQQAIAVMDLMREAAQLSMTRRRTMRFELDLTNPGQPVARIVDESIGIGGQTIKTVQLDPPKYVRMDVMPDGIAVPDPPGFPAVEISGVVSARFRSNGSVVSTAGLPISGTLIFWPPITEPTYVEDNLEPRRSEEVRAVTMDGTAGAMRMWKYTGSEWVEGQ
jgi:prepilin-type N-terminal cleavage/methylation domain-containing protein